MSSGASFGADIISDRKPDSNSIRRRTTRKQHSSVLSPATPSRGSSKGRQHSNVKLLNKKTFKEDKQQMGAHKRNSNDYQEERQHFLGTSANSNPASSTTSGIHSSSSLFNTTLRSAGSQNVSLGRPIGRAKLVREESMMDTQYDQLDHKESPNAKTNSKSSRCSRMLLNLVKKKRFFIPLLIVSCIAAIYCVPFIEIDTRARKKLPTIPFNFRDGPLRPSTASQFKTEHLFQNQVQGPESIALDSMGNMYMAIEGGFILYAHLNKSSPLKRHYYEIQNQQTPSLQGVSPTTISNIQDNISDPVKIAELNGIKQLPYESRRRVREGQDSASSSSTTGGSWRRECQLDEKLYGQTLYSGALNTQLSHNEIDSGPETNKFRSNVIISRCSKPLGIRLSPDESYLYVVDTLSGLYRISLRVAERPYSTQRLVTKLVDFRTHKDRLLRVIQLDAQSDNQRHLQARQSVNVPIESNEGSSIARGRNFMNISLKAIDDLVIDYGAGSRGGDLIYMTVASQNWLALSFLYDMLEARPSGVILCYDSGSNVLSVMDPNRMAQVRTSVSELESTSSRLYNTVNETTDEPYLGIGAPRLDENDVFDDRPLHFPNGLEITDDRQALLIADTSNKRIIKHYIRGPRKGNSDLWAWTPHFPDNIRRGHDKNFETYWVVGCGEDMSDKFDLLSFLDSWPRLRKYLLKNIYMFGWLIEMFGTHIYQSNGIRDFGYSFKIGHSFLQQMCPGMMIIQYNNHGDIIRSIHSREFPNDLSLYSQVNEIVDPKTQEHILYLSSPAYAYVTKLVLPSDVHPQLDQ